MKHYRYRLTDFLNEEVRDDADTKQFYGGDSDTGEQAGKPGNADVNSKTIADIYASGVKIYHDASAAIKQNTDVKGDLDIKDLKASTHAKVKLPFAQGKIDSVVDLRKGTLSTVGEFDVKIGDKSYKAKIKDMDLTDPTKIKNSPFSLTVDGPKGPQTFKFQIRPGSQGKGTKYSAGYAKSGKLGDNPQSKARYSFSVNAVVPPNVTSAKGDFNLVLNQLNSKKTDTGTTVNVGGSASKEGVSLKVGGGKTFNFEPIGTGGKVNVSGYVTGGKEFGQKGPVVGTGVQATFSLPGQQKSSPTKGAKIAGKALEQIPKYVDLSTDVKKGDLKTDKEGKSKISGDIEAIKKDIESAAVKTKDAVDKIKENKFLMSRSELKIFIESMIKF